MAARGVRISGGSARGVPLVEPRGVRLRPTSGLVREAIFNILADRVTGARVLDLYAGTGALGVEALSRGAASATFVEGEAGAVQAILQSLARTGFAAAGTVVRGRLPQALNTITGEFDLIFMDPPYNEESAVETLRASEAKLATSGIVVYEHGSRYNPPDRLDRLQQLDRRLYGDSAISLYVHLEGE
jgi:16S rRNA (guanine(966)-N(2))-methyltransferase RsmD